MTTREAIIDLADQLIREKGYNAFSFKDISNDLGIKTASIHYHFPTKTDLGVATIRQHMERFEMFKKKLEGKSPMIRIQRFLALYSTIRLENRVCLVGSLAPDLRTVDKAIEKELSVFAESVLEWMTEALEEGKRRKMFHFRVPARTKALMIITSILAIVQLARLTDNKDFEAVKSAIIKELKNT